MKRSLQSLTTIGRRDENSSQGGGGLRISSDRDDRIGLNIKTKKNPMPNFQKNSCLKQATQQNTCQILLPQKTRNRKFQTLSLSLEIRSIPPPPPPPGDLNGWFRAVQGVKTTLTSHRGKPVLVSRLNKSFLLMSKNACFSC